jgi:nitroreductase
METWDAMTARRQVREFADTPVDADVLRQVLEAGRRSPSAMNRQRWDFVVVTDQATKAELARSWRGAHWTADAPVVIAVIAPEVDEEVSKLSVEYDLGQAVTAMLLAATDLGLATGQSSSRDQDLVRSTLNLPTDRYCSKLLAVGHPADRALAPIKNPDRRPFDDVVHWDRW